MAAFHRWVPPHCWVDRSMKLGDWAPSLHAHYRHFHATTSPSAPVPRIGTRALVGPPLGLLPSHRGDRFPGSMFEPESDSRHLHAGRHAGGKRISPALIPEQRLNPGFDVIPTLSTRHRWFTRVRLSDSHLTRSRRAFSLTLTTGALDPSRSRWFGACLRRPAPRGLPSSRTHIAWRTSSSPGEFHPQALTEPDGSLSAHPALITRPSALSPLKAPPHRWVDLTTKLSHGLRLPARFLPIAGLTRRRTWVIGPLRSMPITGTSTLLRAHPPLCPASVLWPGAIAPMPRISAEIERFSVRESLQSR